MRNALYQGKATKLLKELSKLDIFKASTDKSLSSKRMRDTYVILRFLAMFLLIDKRLVDENENIYEYKSDIDDLLGKTMEYINDCSDEQIEFLKTSFIKAMKNSLKYIGNNAYRLPNDKGGNKKPLNMAVFETIAYWMVYTDENLASIEKINGAYKKLITNQEYLNVVRAARDTSTNVNQRFTIIKRLMEELNVN